MSLMRSEETLPKATQSGPFIRLLASKTQEQKAKELRDNLYLLFKLKKKKENG